MTDTYKKLTQIEHCLLRPSMYIGSTVPHTSSEYIPVNNKMEKTSVTYSPAFQKLIDEVISNSVDESLRKGTKLDTIWVEASILTGEITVRDNGGIPVVYKSNLGAYVPEAVFSELLCGSNFDDDEDRFGVGTNGLGAKLTNIFSTEFNVTTSDGKKKFVQKFSNNLQGKSDPIITKSTERFTEIRWLPDYTRLETSLVGGNMDMLKKRIHTAAATNKNLKIFFNGERVKYLSFKSYIYAFSEASSVIYQQNKDWQIGVCPNEGFEHISHINGCETSSGGSHVDYITNQIVDKVRVFLKKKHKTDVLPAQIRNHFRVFINARISNPKYSSQTKDKLITEPKDFGASIEISDKTIDDILNSEIIQSVLDWINSKSKAAELAALRKKSKENRNKRVATHISATGPNVEKNTLFLQEGQSASVQFLNVRDVKTQGCYSLKGKPKNWKNSKSMLDVAKNKEISEMMSIIGLEFGKKPTLLNYGTIAISADADLDGNNIAGLLINFFSLWKELIQQGRLKILRAPIMVVCKGKNKKCFYSMDEYNKVSSKYKGWDKKYLKGLGSMNEEEYSIMLNEPVLDTVIWDDSAEDSLDMAFGDDTQKRKDWLM
ncbi:MAG: ATP-binding protein [Ghiorsea sp.]